MRIVPSFFIVLALAGSIAAPGPAPAQADREAIVQGLQELVHRNAPFEELNRFLNAHHSSAEVFCATIPEHPDCLQKPAFKFLNWESATLRLMADSLRVQASVSTIHLGMACLQAGTGTVRVQPIAASGAALAATVTQVTCAARHDTVYLDLEQRGEYGFGRTDAQTAQQLVVDFPAP